MEDLPRYDFEEWNRIRESWNARDFSYSVTLTSAKKEPTVGDLFYQAVESIERIQTRDNLVRILFFVCQHEEESRPHLHGFISSDLSQRKLQAALKGGFGKVEKLPTWWTDYIHKQAIRGCHVTYGLKEIFDEKRW